MTIKQFKKRVKQFLDAHAPSVSARAHQYLHALRLGPYTFVPQAMDAPPFLELLRKGIAISNEQVPSLMPRVPHIVLYTHGLSSGGAERQWCYLALELARRGYTVTLLTDSLAGEEGHYLTLLTGSPVQVLTIDTLHISKKIVNSVPITHIPYAVYKCMLAFALLKPSHILLQLDDTNICGGAAGILHDGAIQKILLSFRNVNPSNFPHFYKPYMKMLYRELAASSHIILSGNSKYGNDDYAHWLGIPQDTVQCIHNALHMPTMQCTDALRDSLHISKDAFIILAVFRLSPEKNPFLLLKIVCELRKKFPNVVAVHAGVGVLEGSAKTCATKYGLEDAIHFLGNRTDISQLMQMADMLLLTSDHEGLPNVILEAQAAGLPVVSTRVGGVPEAVIEGKTALLAPRGDAHTLIAHCAMLLNDLDLRQHMGDDGQAFVHEHFSHTALGDYTLDAIDLPHVCPPALQSPHAPLPQEGILTEDAYFLRTLVDAVQGEPVAFFVEHTMPWIFQLSKGSLCIAATQDLVQSNVPTVPFDWQASPDWTALLPHISTQKTAVFAKETCLQPHIRQCLAQCGLTHILFAASGNIYKIPVIHPPLYKRLGKAIQFLWNE